jgi:hypothetical protein
MEVDGVGCPRSLYAPGAGFDMHCLRQSPAGAQDRARCVRPRNGQARASQTPLDRRLARSCATPRSPIFLDGLGTPSIRTVFTDLWVAASQARVLNTSSDDDNDRVAGGDLNLPAVGNVPTIAGDQVDEQQQQRPPGWLGKDGKGEPQFRGKMYSSDSDDYRDRPAAMPREGTNRTRRDSVTVGVPDIYDDLLARVAATCDSDFDDEEADC